MTTNNNSGLGTQQLKLLQKKAKEVKDQKFLQNSRKRLSEIAEKKMKTCFIGSIAAFEEVFGFLWGYGKKSHERTEEEENFFQLWTQVRNRILTNGNNQIRGFDNELERNTVHWDRFQMNMKPRIEEKGQEDDN